MEIVIRHRWISETSKQPPTKAGGFELWTGSPDTRRLNDASLWCFHLKFIVWIRLKMILQILFNHLFRYLPNCDAEISSCPKMSPPISLLQMWKLLEQSTCRIAFDPPHNLTGCHSRRGTHQNMHMAPANYTAHDPYLERFTNLTN